VAAVEAAHALPYPFLITARAENHIRGNPDLDEIARLQAYERAGADVLCAPGLATVEEIRAVCGAVSRPVNVLARPDLSLRQIVDAGAQRISVGGALTWVAAAAMASAHPTQAQLWLHFLVNTSTIVATVDAALAAPTVVLVLPAAHAGDADRSAQAEARVQQVNSSTSMADVTVPFAFTVRWDRMCCLPSDPSEPWRMTLSALVMVRLLEFTLSPDRSAKWPVKLSWVGSSGTKVTVPVVVTVTCSAPSSRSVIWTTPDSTIVSVPGAPEQGFSSARETVSLK
jgi:hypothetical protein